MYIYGYIHIYIHKYIYHRVYNLTALFFHSHLFILEVNECETLNPCKHGGVCVNENGTYHCECPEGWRGLNCDVGK